MQSALSSGAIMQYINLFYLVRIRLNSAAATLHNWHICVAVAVIKVNGLSAQSYFYAVKMCKCKYSRIRNEQVKAEKGPDYIKGSATSP